MSEPETMLEAFAERRELLELVTPVQRCGDYWLKRDDLFHVGRAPGGKVRTCLALARGLAHGAGLVTAGHRESPQVNIVATVAQHLGVPCRVHVPASSQPWSPEVVAAAEAGAHVLEHRPGHTSVIAARAREDAEALGWRYIPFGMECEEAVLQTAAQVVELPDDVQRIVVPVGSGMSLAGVLRGLTRQDWPPQVLGVQVGADPSSRLAQYAPPPWRVPYTLTTAAVPYHQHAAVTELEGVELDPVYEAKCIPHLEPGDLLWIVGIRPTLYPL